MTSVYLHKSAHQLCSTLHYIFYITRISHWSFLFFFLNAPPPTKISPLPLHDPLPISAVAAAAGIIMAASLATPQQVVLDIGQNKKPAGSGGVTLPNSGTNDLGKQAPSQVIPTSVRSEEHTSELQSPCNLVCRLLLEKK